ncbi:MAG: cytochrome c biogenesis protein ResB [Alysiella sp.]|uniref:cytochrome c biogenesis protein ResB n=1 Tax=Alysiella sp. TaxID=1872483 RepID=UPI0026DA9756|nr:cytochrome c biogenesis protein ResB [Alysiella sp.]MDO4433348.1 cytochrome c biogenesis protein ResB [Alysiella sp.]
MSQTTSKKSLPLIRRPWFAFLSSMRFAVALLTVLAIASIIGTVVEQNQPAQNYVVQFGPFWAEIFGFLGLYDVYASSWFVVIMIFLVLSTGLCLWRNIPPFLREMRSFRLKATAQSLAHMKHTAQLSGSLNALSPDIAAQYLKVNGFQSKMVQREDGSVLLAAKKGAMNKWGYIFAHAAIIVICVGGLIDSNLLLKIGMLTGQVVPDTSSIFARDFKPESSLSEHNLSFRGNAEVVEGQTADVVFLNADKGLLLQKLPFTVELKKFHIEFYDTGMPKDFASDIVVTDKETGEKIEKTIRVNHPLTHKGITIYQSSYGDGGSDIALKSWNLRGIGAPVTMNAVSQRQFPLDLGTVGQYRLEFGELRVFNVENLNEQEAENGNRLHEVRSVNQEKKFQNVGPTITYKLRDSAGQAREYVSYMLPLQREGALFFATGERSDVNEPYRWLMLPADPNGKVDSFMALRQFLMQPEKRTQIVEQAILTVDEKMRPQFKLAVDNLLRQFAEGGYVAINEHIKNNVPKAEQEKTGQFMYQILYGAMGIVLDKALKDAGLPEIVAGETRNTFLLNSMDGYTALTRMNAPILLQLESFKQVNMSGLQMTKSPGATLVYIGSMLLVLGTIFMFYVREKRAWLLFDNNGIRFAMSSSRHERDLNHEFSEHLQKLEMLACDLAI